MYGRLIVLLLVIFIGCGKTDTETAPANDSTDNADRTSETNQGQAGPIDWTGHHHGPNGGHLFQLTPADYIGEWVQSSRDEIVKVFILDPKSRQNVAVNVDSLVLKRGDNLFSLDAVEPNGDGLSAQYALSDRNLSIAVNLGVSVELVIGDKIYEGEIKSAH